MNDHGHISNNNTRHNQEAEEEHGPNHNNNNNNNNNASYAHPHVPSFLRMPLTNVNEHQDVIQVVACGASLTAARLRRGTTLTSKDDDDDDDDDHGSSSSSLRSLTLDNPILVTDTPESIGMTVPSYHNNNNNNNNKKNNNNHDGNDDQNEFTIRDVAHLVGEAHPVHVLDVQLQTELEGWCLGDLVEYFAYKNQYPNEKCKQQPQQHEPHGTNMAGTAGHVVQRPETSQRPPRRAAALQSQANNIMTKPAVLNQLSLEFSHTRMGPPFCVSPQFVRDLDWIDHCWKQNNNNNGKDDHLRHHHHHHRNNNNNNNIDNNEPYPKVQYYCLTSAAGAWTDFHMDMGGSSVWYHVLSGRKEFCLIAPNTLAKEESNHNNTNNNLQAYQAWLCSKHQEADFFPDTLRNGKSDNISDNHSDCDLGIYKICLPAHQTLIIPSGWIHAVYTPVDSLVLGGNFLHGLAMERQLQAHAMEEASRVPADMRFPYFRQLHVYAVSYYYAKLIQGKGCISDNNTLLVPRERQSLLPLINQVEVWVEKDVAASRRSSNKPKKFAAQVVKEPVVHEIAQQVANQHGFSCFADFSIDFRRRLLEQQTPIATRSAVDAASSSFLKKPKLRLRLGGASISASSVAGLNTNRQAKAAQNDSSLDDIQEDESKHKEAADNEHDAEGQDDEDEDEPLIKLSKKQHALPIPPSFSPPRKRREGVASFIDPDHGDNDDDDEWKPPVTASSSSFAGARRPTPNQSPTRNQGDRKRSKVAASPSAARSRLWKKMR